MVSLSPAFYRRSNCLYTSQPVLRTYSKRIEFVLNTARFVQRALSGNRTTHYLSLVLELSLFSLIFQSGAQTGASTVGLAPTMHTINCGHNLFVSWNPRPVSGGVSRLTSLYAGWCLSPQWIMWESNPLS